MMQGRWLIWVLGGLLGAGAISALAARVGLDARIRRRRRKSHGRIISKSNRPTVKFSVRPPKE